MSFVLLFKLRKAFDRLHKISYLILLTKFIYCATMEQNAKRFVPRKNWAVALCASSAVGGTPILHQGIYPIMEQNAKRFVPRKNWAVALCASSAVGGAPILHQGIYPMMEQNHCFTNTNNSGKPSNGLGRMENPVLFFR